MVEHEPETGGERQPGLQRGGCGRGLCLLGTLLVSVYLIAVIVVEKAFGEEHLLTFMLVYMPQPPLLVPPVVMALVCCALRQARLACANVAMLALAVIVLVPPVLPRAAPKTVSGQRVRIVTWNVHQELRNLPDIQRTLAQLRPDVVCLQEARLEGLSEALPQAEAARTHEVQTLVQGRIVRQRAVPLSDPSHYRWGLETEIELPQGRLTVLNVHYVVGMKSRLRSARHDRPDPIQITREKQNSAVVKWLRETHGPRIVCGDINTPPNVQMYRDLAAEATNAFARAGLGWGFTFPRRLPMTRIDHTWCAGGVEPVTARAMDGLASDHLLLVTDVLLPQDAERTSP